MIRNVHSRIVATDPDRFAETIERVSDPRAGLWSAERWPPLILDDGLEPGSAGGHGPVRYHVIAHQPGRRVEFRFDSLGLDGTHALEVLPGRVAEATLLRHVLLADTHRLVDRLRWILILRPLHDAMLEDILDRFGTAVGHPPRRPARWSPYVRLLRRLLAVDRRRQTRRASPARSG